MTPEQVANANRDLIRNYVDFLAADLNLDDKKKLILHWNLLDLLKETSENMMKMFEWDDVEYTNDVLENWNKIGRKR